MTKYLATTAVAALLLSSAAIAGEGATIKNALPGIDVTIGGTINAYGGYLDDKAKDTRDSNVDILGDGTLRIQAEGRAENAMTYGGSIEAYVSTDRDIEIDRAWLWVGTPFAKFHFGDNDGAATLLRVGAPNLGAGTLNHSDPGTLRSSYWLRFSGYGPLLSDVYNSGTSTKVSVVSENLNGFRIGASFTPTADVGSNITFDREIKDIFEVAGRYENKLANGVGYSVGGGFGQGEVFGETLRIWNLGANVNWQRFAVGGNFMRAEDSAGKVDSWTVGATYGWQKFTFGANYANEKISMVGFDSTSVDIYSLGTTYQVTRNMALHSDLGFVKGQDSTADATVFTTGLRLSF